MQQQSRTRRILMVTAVTAVLTAGGTGLAFAQSSSGPSGPAPAETSYLVVEDTPQKDDCPYRSPAAQATLTFESGNRL